MAVETETTYNGPLLANGVTTEFPFTFRVMAADEVAVMTRDDGVDTIVPSLDYTVVLEGDDGGTVTFDTAPADGLEVFISSEPAFTQLIEFENGSRWLAGPVNEANDRATVRELWLKDRSERSILAPLGETPDLILPTPSNRADKLIGFDGTGGLLVSVDHAALIAAAASTAAARDEAVEAAQQATAVVTGDIPIMTVTGSYTPALGDRGKHIRVNASADALITISDADGKSAGWWAWIEQMGPSPVYVLAGAGMTIRSLNGQNQLAGQYGKAKIMLTPIAHEALLTDDLDGIYVPPPPPEIAAPVYDSFAAPTGTINARATETGGLVWATTFYAGANANALSVINAGKLSGLQGTAPQQSFGHVTVPASNRKWVRRKMEVITALQNSNVSSSSFVASHLTVGVGNFSALGLGHSAASGNPGSLSVRAVVAGVVGTNGSFGTFITLVNSDTVDLRWDMSGSSNIVSALLNGRKVGPDINITTLAPTLPITHVYGFRGNIALDSVDEFMVGDPLSQGMISLFAPQRIQQMESDGAVNPKLYGELTMQDPESLEVEIEDSTGASIAAWTTVANYAFDEGDMSFAGDGPQISAPPSDGYRYRVRRNDIVGADVSYSNWSPITKAGHVVLFTGQSLETQMVSVTSGGSLAAPADSWFVHGWLGVGGTVTHANPYDRRQLKLTSNTPLATFAYTIQDNSSLFPFQAVLGGRGGTNTAERLPGTANNDAQLDGITHAGRDVGSFVVIAGQFDLFDADLIDAFAANNNAIIDSVEDLTGRPIKGIIVPLTSVWGANDADSERLRKIMWQMCQDQPDRWFWGPPLMDLQHVGGDIYHFTNAAYNEQARRIAWSWNKMRAEVINDRSGIDIVSVTRDSDSQCTVTFELNGADDISLLNVAYAGDRRGGLRFAGDPDFATTYSPSGHTINAVVGTTQSVTYGFAGSPFPVTCYVSGPYGTEPFNPDGDVTIRADYAGKASMLVGNYSGEPSVPVKPYYQEVGGDYVFDS